MNDRVIWQENLKMTQKIVWICIACSWLSFVIAGAIHYLETGKGLLTLLKEHYATIGTVLFAVLCAALFFGYRHPKRNLKQTDEDRATLRSLLGKAILCFMLFGVFYLIAAFRAEENTSTSLPATMFAMAGVSMILFAGLADRMAQTIKEKHLT